MLNLYVQVQRSLRSIKLLAFLIWAFVATFDIIGTATVMLFAARAISLTLESVQVLIVEALDFESLH
jgi:hypothetical protein